MISSMILRSPNLAGGGDVRVIHLYERAPHARGGLAVSRPTRKVTMHLTPTEANQLTSLWGAPSDGGYAFPSGALKHFDTGGPATASLTDPHDVSLVGFYSPRPTIPGGTDTTTPASDPSLFRRRTTTPVDYYTYGEGPEHQFFESNVVPGQPTFPHTDTTIPAAGTGGGSGNSTAAGIVGAGAALKGLSSLGEAAGYDNSLTQGAGTLGNLATGNYAGAAKDAVKLYGSLAGSGLSSAGSGALANSALTDAGFGAGWTTPVLDLGTTAGTSAGTAAGTAAGTSAGSAAGGAGAGAGAGAGGAGGASAAAPLGATAAGAAIIAAAAAGLLSSKDKANAQRRAVTNQQARDSLESYLTSRGSMPTQTDTSLPAWLQPDTAQTYADYFKLPNLTAEQFRALPIDQQQKYADQWAQDTGSAYMAGKVEGQQYDSGAKGLSLTQRQQDINKYNILAGGYQVPTGLDESQLQDLYRTGASAYGYAGGGALGYAAGSSNHVRGPGTGRSDSIPAQLSDGEYVLTAEDVSLLGDGSNEAGAKRLDQFRQQLRKHKGAALARGKISPDAKAPMQYLKGMR